MNLNMYNWMIDTDFFWSVFKVLGAVFLGLTVMVLYVYLKVHQNDIDELDESCEVKRIASGKSIRKK